MIYQTFTQKEKKISKEEIMKFRKSFYYTLEKYCRNPEKYKSEHHVVFNFPGIGGIIVQGKWNKKLIYQGIECTGCYEYLGFRDTKKFNKMVEDMKKSLEDICYIHTGKTNNLNKKP